MMQYDDDDDNYDYADDDKNEATRKIDFISKVDKRPWHLPVLQRRL